MAANVCKVPKDMKADELIWAFRRGVVEAMHSRGRVLRHGPSSYAIAPRRTFMLADRVRREYLRRHPA